MLQLNHFVSIIKSSHHHHHHCYYSAVVVVVLAVVKLPASVATVVVLTVPAPFEPEI